MMWPLWKTVHTLLKKLKLTYELVKLLLGLNPKELSVGTLTDTFTRIFIPAPFTTDKREMQPKHGFIHGQWISKMLYKQSYPSNNTDLNCTGPLTTGFFSINTYYDMSHGF